MSRRILVLTVGFTLMQSGCTSPPHPTERMPSPTAAAAPPPTDELALVRSACGVLSEACVQRAVSILSTHPDAAAKILSDACADGIATGCVELGHAYSEGGALPPDQVRADDAYAKACRLDPSWCD